MQDGIFYFSLSLALLTNSSGAFDADGDGTEACIFSHFRCFFSYNSRVYYKKMAKKIIAYHPEVLADPKKKANKL
jgi:hypothetical protein